MRKAVRNPFFVPRKFRHIEIAKKQKKKGKSNMERREKRMRVTGKHILLKGILGVYSMYAFAVLVMRLMSYRPLPLPLLWIGEAGFTVSLMLLPNAVSAEDPKKDEIFFGSMLLLFGMLLVVGAAGVFCRLRGRLFVCLFFLFFCFVHIGYKNITKKGKIK